MSRQHRTVDGYRGAVLEHVTDWLQAPPAPIFTVAYDDRNTCELTIRELVNELGPHAVQIAASHGKSAKRLSERLARNVLTWHRLIYRIDADGGHHGFTPRTDGPLNHPDTRLVVIWDADKLTAREAGELMASGKPVLLCLHGDAPMSKDAFLQSRKPDARLVETAPRRMADEPLAPWRTDDPVTRDSLRRLLDAWLERPAADGTWFQINVAMVEGERDAVEQAIREAVEDECQLPDTPKGEGDDAESDAPDVDALRSQAHAGEVLLLSAERRWHYSLGVLRTLARSGDVVLLTRTGCTGPVKSDDDVLTGGYEAVEAEAHKLAGNFALHLEDGQPVRIASTKPWKKMNVFAGDLFVPAD